VKLSDTYVPAHSHASGQLIKLLIVLRPWTAVRYGERGGKQDFFVRGRHRMGSLGTTKAM
jgi:hypothetical protein